MFNIIETPWLILAVSIITLGIVVMSRQGFGPKKNWHYLIPVSIAIFGIGIDNFIRTDNEKIMTCLKQAFRFAETNNFKYFDVVFAPDYSDSIHPSRDHLRAKCQISLAMHDIEKIAQRRLDIEDINADTATILSSLLIRLVAGESNSYTGGTSMFYVEVRFQFKKQDNGEWMIITCDPISVNNQPLNWSSVP